MKKAPAGTTDEIKVVAQNRKVSHEYFIHELTGLLVVTDTGEELGKVFEVIETGANDVLVVARPTGGEALIPMIRDVIVELNVAAGRIVIHPLEGLL